MMLAWLGEQRGIPVLEAAAAEIERAVDEVLVDPASRTRDLGGSIGCKEFGSRVAAAIRSEVPARKTGT